MKHILVACTLRKYGLVSARQPRVTVILRTATFVVQNVNLRLHSLF